MAFCCFETIHLRVAPAMMGYIGLSPLGQPVLSQEVAREPSPPQKYKGLIFYDTVMQALSRSAAAEPACLAEKRPDWSSSPALLLL